MMRIALYLLSLAMAVYPLRAQSDEPSFPLTTTVLTSPSSSPSHSPVLATSSDGDVYLSWIESADSGEQLLVSQYDQADQKWASPHPITTSAAFANSSADTPIITAGRNHSLAAAWLNDTSNAGTMAYLSRSDDGGNTWDPPTRLTNESNQVAFPNISFWRSGKILAAWLDGRVSGETRLYARVVGNGEPDTLIAESVNKSNPDLTVFPNSSALLVYRRHDEEGILNIHRVSWDGREWSEPRFLFHVGWHTDHFEGPRLHSFGGQAAAIWFTAAFNSPQLWSSTSPDAGERFTLPLQLDLGHPAGGADLRMLRDGSVIAIWVEHGDAPGLYLRRIAPSQKLSPPVRLAIIKSNGAIGSPRLTLVKDYDATPAQLIVTYTQDKKVHTLLVTLPDLSTLAGRKPCVPCDEDNANATRGYPIKGRVTKVMAERGMVLVKHEEIPGVMRAMTMAFKVEVGILEQLTLGQELLGRIERQGRDWHLFSVKLLGSPKNKAP